MGQRADRVRKHDSGVVENLPELDGRSRAVMFQQIGLASEVGRIQLALRFRVHSPRLREINIKGIDFLGADVARKQQFTVWSEAEFLAAVSDYPTEPREICECFASTV